MKEETSLSEERLRKRREIVLQYRYLDDDFMSRALNDKKTINTVLNIIMGRRLTVLSVMAQDTVANLFGHGVRFDVIATDEEGIIYDIEIQRAREGANPKRARFNAAMIDSRALDKGTEYRDLPQTVIIFITETDVLEDGLPIQHFHFTSDETGKQLQTGQEIIYVDSSCQQDTPLGSLMHDFHCRDARDIRNKDLARRMEEIKTNESEVARMCQAVEEYGNERERETMLVNIRALMQNLGLSCEAALKALNVPQKDWDRYRSLMPKGT